VPGNEEVAASVQLRPGATARAQDLAALIAGRLVPYREPAEIILLDVLPIKHTGKIPKQRRTRQAARGPHPRRDQAKPSDNEEPTEMDHPRNASVAVIGAGDFIGAAIARRFAAGGYAVFAGRRNGDRLAPLVAEIEAAGGRCSGRTLDARKEESVVGFLAEAERTAPLETCVFNIGVNVNFPILETTERVFRKVWEMACYSGFLAGREATRLMLPRGRGTIIFTGATASLRGGPGYAAFASAKFGLRALAQSMARELGPKNIHVAHLVIDSGVDTTWVRERRRERLGKESFEPDELVNPSSIAETYWQLHLQPRDAWTHELDLRPYGERW
jgi:NAD(P)-dependent dehydrogenase (short-subunit alcohol dehydrogenase family)